MKKHIAIALAALAIGGAAATTATAIPVTVKATSQEDNRLYVDFNYYLPYTASTNASFYATVWTYTQHPRRVRALGRHEVTDDYYGWNSNYAWFNYITVLRPGTYYACIRAVAGLNNGTVTAHMSCRRFALK